MIEPAKIQAIYQGSVPAFVVVPFADFAREHPREAAEIVRSRPRIPDGDAVLHEVVRAHVEQGITYLRARRLTFPVTTPE